MFQRYHRVDVAKRHPSCAIHGHETEPERGSRCLECFRMRLLSVARRCKDMGLTTFTTTLASSRWKRLDQIAEIGYWAASQVGGVQFDDRNWRKGGLQQRRNELFREYGFYNQVFCGCEYSIAARLSQMQKAELRQWIKGLKSARSARWIKEKSNEACSRLMSDGLWRAAGTVLLYHPLPDEVDTSLLLDNALQTGKRVLLPKVVGDDLELRIYTPGSLQPGAYGIMEPTEEVFLPSVRVGRWVCHILVRTKEDCSRFPFPLPNKTFLYPLYSQKEWE